MRLRLIIGVLLLLAGRASADGAFPDSLSMFVPADRPNEIILTTNFGLVISEDAGGSWYLVCEQAIASLSFVGGYQMGAAPDETLFARSARGLAYSTDRGCSWHFATGNLDHVNVIDVFADALDPMSVFAIAHIATDGDMVDLVYQSSDGGRSFPGAPLYTAAANVSLTGVEKARTAPQTLYLTLFSYPPLTPMLARSNGGAPFQFMDESAFISSQPYLAAVDPTDASLLYLRLRGQGDALAISRDAGATIGTVIPINGLMSALLRRANGTILVGSSDGKSLRSVDGGHTFAAWPTPRVRALGERAGVLYVAADDVKDGYALARSTDEGAHWAPLLNFRDISGPLQCGNLPAVCAAPFAAVMALFNPPHDGGVDATPAADMSAALPPHVLPLPHAGCGCTVTQKVAPPPLAWSLLGAALLLARARRQRSI